jgi:predicted Fe-S protein YdhL (DUF1289 family)
VKCCFVRMFCAGCFGEIFEITGWESLCIGPRARSVEIIIVTRQRQASGFVAARLGSDMVVGTYVGKEVGV